MVFEQFFHKICIAFLAVADSECKKNVMHDRNNGWKKTKTVYKQKHSSWRVAKVSELEDLFNSVYHENFLYKLEKLETMNEIFH